MGWTWKEEHLDLILVPFGLLIMFIYHLFLLYKYMWYHESTSIGFENCNKEAWVGNMLRIEAKDRGFAVSVLNGHLSASTSLTSISLVLCSLIGGLLGNSSSNNFFSSSFIFGDSSKSTNSIKYIAILSCFILAFACFVQTTRHYVHACFLISMRNGDVPAKCIQKAVLRGSNFWAAGLRALYFATNLLLWIFGPIPMFVGSVVTVIVLYHLDVNTETMIDFGPDKNGTGAYAPKTTTRQETTSVVDDFEHNGKPSTYG